MICILYVKFRKKEKNLFKNSTPILYAEAINFDCQDKIVEYMCVQFYVKRRISVRL